MLRILRFRDSGRARHADATESVASPPEFESWQPPASEVADDHATPALPGSFAYTHTRVFTPPARVLDDSRVLDPDADTPSAAAFRMLRTMVLQRMDACGWRSMAVFGATPNDGKTTAALNLAISMANDQTHSVLLVDFDFRRPALATRLGLAPEFGVDDALTGAARIEDCLYHPAGLERLVLLPARRTLSRSSAVLAGPRCRDIVSELRNRYPDRIVLFDLPPVLMSDDALAFAPLVECGLVIADASRTRRDDLVRTIELLHKTPLLGTVLNRAARVPGGY
jgi:Mrp family chromosome partitioning ATPase